MASAVCESYSAAVDAGMMMSTSLAIVKWAQDLNQTLFFSRYKESMQMLTASSEQSERVRQRGASDDDITASAVQIVEDMLSRMITQVKVSDIKAFRKKGDQNCFHSLREFVTELRDACDSNDFLASSLKGDVEFIFAVVMVDKLEDKLMCKRELDEFASAEAGESKLPQFVKLK